MPCASFTNHHRRARHHNAGSLARLRVGMADRLEDLLRASTVRCWAARQRGGVFVAPGRVLTCVHVTGDGGWVR